MAYNSDVEDIETLFNRLYDGSIVKARVWFEQEGFYVNDHSFGDQKMVLIRYKNSTHRWKNLWPIQCRGVVLLYLENRWKVVKYMLDRGPEVLTFEHKKVGIETNENMFGLDIGIFNNDQKTVIHKLLNSNSTLLDGYLTMKVDGMLVPITLYTGELGSIFREYIRSTNNVFHQTLLDMVDELGFSFVPIISTQNTVSVELPKIISYIVTSVVVSTTTISYNECVELFKNMEPVKVFRKFGTNFIKILCVLYKELPQNDWTTICFEMVCRGRTCANGVVHEELATSYDTTNIYTLSYAQSLKVIPHFMFSKVIQKAGFKEPSWWKVSSSGYVNSMVQNLSNTIMKKMGVDEFYQKNPPSNSRFSGYHFDPEGFVFWVHPIKYKGNLVYLKVKSKEYYESHNQKDIKRLLEIGRCTTVFPDATKTLDFFNNLESRLADVCKIMLNQITKHNNELFNGLTERAQNGFWDKPNDIQLKSFLNGSTYAPTVINISFSKVFEGIDFSEHTKVLRMLSMRMQFWDSDNSEAIRKMVSELNHYLVEFYHIVKKSMVKDEPYAEVEGFNIFGCPLSTDLDIVLKVKSREDLSRRINLEMIQEELDKLGYRDKEIDYNLIYVEDGVVVEASKGASNETNNILFYTYGCHKQVYPRFVDKTLRLDIVAKIRSIGKFILDNMKGLMSKKLYKEERPKRVQVYQGLWNRVDYAVSIFHHFYEEVPKKDMKWLSCMKSIVMKLVQLILLSKGEEEYTKIGLAKKAGQLFPDLENGVLWYLTRGTQGMYNKRVLPELVEFYKDIATKWKPDDVDWMTLDVDTLINTTGLPDDVYKEFMGSPLEPTPKFVSRFMEICPNGDIGKLFPLVCLNINRLPQNVQDHVVAVDQRSDEWQNLLKFYKCGKNSGITQYSGSQWVTIYYNLIRGSLGEAVVVNGVDYSKLFPNKVVEKVLIGLLVEKKGVKGSIGCAPDMLLVVDSEEVVPVEIKCLGQPPVDNADFRREVDLAQRQLATVKNIIGCSRGLIVFLHMYKDGDKVIHKIRSAFI